MGKPRPSVDFMMPAAERKKKRFLLCAPTLIACFKVLRHNTKTNKQTKTTMSRTRKNKTSHPCFTTFFLFIKFGHDDERKQKNCYHYYRYNNTQINYYTL